MKSKLLVTGAIAAMTMIAAACGSTSQSTAGVSPSPATASPVASPAATAAATAATIAVATNATLGQILVDGNGMTIYLFVADTGKTSTCYNACAQYWPPVLTTGAPKAGAGATASLLGTTTRTDGTVQVTYAGHPLYRFLTDKKPGDTTGQGLNLSGGLWYVMSAAGVAMH